jgi:CrcB protein
LAFPRIEFMPALRRDSAAVSSSESAVVLSIALGGAIGSVARYAVGLMIPPTIGSAIPIATLSVNVSGSFLIGLFMVVALEGLSTAATRLFLTTGLCGGYTTMSAFNLDTVAMVRGGMPAKAALYVIATVLGSLSATFIGMMTARRLTAAARRR